MKIPVGIPVIENPAVIELDDQTKKYLEQRSDLTENEKNSIHIFRRHKRSTDMQDLFDSESTRR